MSRCRSVAGRERTSRRQLPDTVQRIEDALFGDPGRLDRDLWLSRIADLLLDGTTAWANRQRSRPFVTAYVRA